MSAPAGDLRYVLDTNHAYLLLPEPRQLPARYEAAMQVGHVALCAPSVGELWFMVMNSSRQADNRRDLVRLLEAYHTLPLDELAAEAFGQIRFELRRAGRQIPQIDCQIAATARSRGLVVVSADRHLHTVANLPVENWLA